MYELVFTDDEIRTQLEAIGLDNVSDHQLRFFREDLERLLREEPKPSHPYNRDSCDSGRSSSRSSVLIEKVEMPAKFKVAAQTKTVSGIEVSGSGESDGGRTIDSSESSTKPRKRKVLRRRNGQSIVCDETEGVSDSSSSPLPRFVNSADTSRGRPSRPWSSMSDLKDGPKPVYRTKSVILPYKHKSRPFCVKTDAVALFHYYKRHWDTHKVPGEKDHKDLRWNIRTMMSYRS